LEDLLRRSRAGLAAGQEAFIGMRLTGGDVFWLAAEALAAAPPGRLTHAQAAGELRREDALKPPLALLHLEGADLSEAVLRGASLREAHLQGASLSAAFFEGVDLSDANLSGTTMERIHLERSLLVSANLRDATLPGAWLDEADLTLADLERANLRETGLRGARLVSSNLMGAILRGARLDQAWLMDANLQRADLEDAHAEEANFYFADLRGANLRSAHLNRANLPFASLDGARLSGAHMESARLVMARLIGADLTNAHLAHADLSAAHLERADLRGTKTHGATFHGAHLRNARLDPAFNEQGSLDGADRLEDLETMPDAARLYPYVASRELTEAQADELCSLTDDWLRVWGSASGCRVSRSRVVQKGRVLIWAIDCRAILGAGANDLTGSDLDPFFRLRDRFGNAQSPPVQITETQALMVDSALVEDGRAISRLMAEGRVTPDSLILHGCTVAQWRAGEFVHRLDDDPDWAAVLLNQTP
jgi:uncharacterized protein YjbI with pentapeptide repeats